MKVGLSKAQRLELERGYCQGEKLCFRMRILTLLLKASGLSATEVGERTGTSHREEMAQAVQGRRAQRPRDSSRQEAQANHGLFGRGNRPSCDRTGSAEREQVSGGVAAVQREGCQLRPIRMAVSYRGFPCPVPEDSNIFGMTTRDNRYEGFTSGGGITATSRSTSSTGCPFGIGEGALSLCLTTPPSTAAKP